MPRSKLDTLTYATILLTPMLVAAGYIAFTPAPAPAPIVIESAAACPELAACTPVDEPVLPAEPAAIEPAAIEPAAIEAAAIDPPAPAATIDPTSLQAGAAMLVYEHQLVLATSPELTWSKGQLRDHRIDWGVAVSKRVDATRLPEPLRALADARVAVYAADGSACIAAIKPDGLTVYGRQDGELLYPEGDNDDITPAQRQTVRGEVFAEAQLLRARLHRDGERCDGVWARAAGLPAPAVFTGSDDEDPALRARVHAMIAPSPRIEAMARAYRHQNDESGADEEPAWPVYLRGNLHVTRWDEIGGTRSFLNVVVGDGGEACSSLFSDQVALLFSLDGDSLTLLDQPGFVGPVAIMDLERDGWLEAVTNNGMTIESRATPTPVQHFEMPYHGCPC